MRYRTLGKTGLKVSEIGFGPEWMDGTPEETREIAEVLRKAGVNYMDCWMADPHIRENLGFAMRGHADEWIVQGHIGSCWVDGQYKRCRPGTSGLRGRTAASGCRPFRDRHDALHRQRR